MWKRQSIPVWRFGVYVVFFLIGSLGLYWGIGTWMTEPSLSWTMPLKGHTIVIDAGHGGVDPGAVSDSGALEKDITLAVAQKLQGMLMQAGAEVQMIRDEDRDLAGEETKGYSRRKSEDLKERSRQIRESQADLFISLHCNTIPSSKSSQGAQTFYDDQVPESELFAKKLQDALQKTMGMTRQVKKRGDIYLLKTTGKVGALVELGFLSNAEETQLLQQDGHQEQLALSVYRGILGYYAEINASP
jgi:N-acetylmuramoyl-L-alanine amidase